MYTYFIITLAVVVIMSAASFLVGRRSRPMNVDAAKCLDLEAQLADSKVQIAKGEERLEALRAEATTLRSERDIERTSRQHLEEQLTTLKSEARETLEKQAASLKEVHAEQIAHLREEQTKQTTSLKEVHAEQIAHLREEQQRQMDEFKALNKKQLNEQLELIREQMRTTSETVLKAREEELGERNVEQVSKIVDPLRQSLKQMQEALNTTNKEHNETMTRLDATIQANMKNSRDLGETAERLTRALVGEVKVQGNFGELKLRQLLEDLGLKEGEQYSTQESLKDEFGASVKDDEDKGLIPDFVLHFPNNRDVIVDSKVNIKAYTDYINTGNESEEAAKCRSQYCAEHIAAVRRQVDLLAKKDYTKYLKTGYSKLNFVIMYMHNEGALNLALMNDSSLWKYAYDKGVLILGPQTMYMNLRILELMWTQSRQLGNQKKIVETAEEMIKRTQIFAERFNEVEKFLKKTTDAVTDLKKSTANEKQSIITSATKLIKLGLKEDKNHVKISSFYVEEDAVQMIGELDAESESVGQMAVVPEGEDEAVEKKYRN
ncbi:MAG: DNA recombination protein RmuC [Alistipes sp.]|nr:DNA recombination protein RmuC [Alistipes sp.]